MSTFIHLHIHALMAEAEAEAVMEGANCSWKRVTNALSHTVMVQPLQFSVLPRDTLRFELGGARGRIT